MAASLIDVAWAAGLFEGEGSCMIRGEQRQPAVSLQMTDEDTVRRFHAIVGRGNVRRYEAYQPGRKPQWQWSVQSGDDVLYVLGMLWPFLLERRRERATEVIERAIKIGDGAGFCQRGHDLSDPKNIYIHQKLGKRHCRVCRDNRSAERRRFLRLAS